MFEKKYFKAHAKKGRPSKYLSKFAELAYQQCLLGRTDVQLAEFFCISVSTLNLWKRIYPVFAEAIQDVKINADAEVAYGSYNRAVGMTLPAVHVSSYQGKITTISYTKHIPPDFNAAKYWLQNRQKKHWGVKEKIGSSVEVLNIVIHEYLK